MRTVLFIGEEDTGTGHGRGQNSTKFAFLTRSFENSVDKVMLSKLLFKRGTLSKKRGGELLTAVGFDRNTSLVALGALAHRLHRLQNPKWPPVGPKWQTGSGKVSTPRFFAILSNFC